MKLRPVNRTAEDIDAPDFIFWCPGCKNSHGVWTTHPNGINGARWIVKELDNNVTIEPSILVKGVINPLGDPETGDFKRGADGKYLVDDKGRLLGAKEYVCHVVVTNGILNFCADSTHELSGKSVPMEDVNER